MKRLVPIMAVAVAATIGCRSGRAGTDVDTGTAPETAEAGVVPVTIVNNNPTQFTIYAVRTGTRVRVGDAVSFTTSTLRLRRTDLDTDNSVRLVADPVGGSDVIRTGLLVVQPGQHIDWTIEAVPANSSAVVR
jgi:hypothetical protein